jgi:MoaA/NifB/PqqE/SkfB family radical SAM enzyme
MRADFRRRRDRGDPCARAPGIELRRRHVRYHARLVARGQAPQFVFVPNRFNIREIVAAYDLAITLGCAAFVTGPMMRIGRAASAWDEIACSDEDWQRSADALRDRAARTNATIALSIYPWDIITEMERRLESPQAMLLVVPNGKVKLLNALPCPADLRRESRRGCPTRTPGAARSRVSRMRTEPRAQARRRHVADALPAANATFAAIALD